MPRREGAFERLTRHFHTHPKGHLHEFLFWSGIGVVLGALTLWGWLAGAVSTPFALMLGVISFCFVGWGMLPQRKAAVKPEPPGRLRRAREQQAPRK